MKLKLIEAAGFIGRKKTAEEDLSNYPEQVQQQVQNFFNAPAEFSAVPPSFARDKEQRFLELEGKTIPLQDVQLNDALTQLVNKLKEGLHF